MWLYQLRKIKLLALFCHHGKLSHRSSGWQVPLLLPSHQAANPSDRWCFIALQRAMGDKNPQPVQIPVHALLFPPQPHPSCHSARNCFPLHHSLVWFHLRLAVSYNNPGTGWLDICIHKYKGKNPQWFSNISISSLITFFLICLCASNFQRGYWNVWAGFQCVLIVGCKIVLHCLFLESLLFLRKDLAFLFHSKSFHTTQGHIRQG